MSGSNRYNYLDTANGILIVYMILGHCYQVFDLSNTPLYRAHVYSLFFFMSWFFYKAGMFHHPQSIVQTIISGSKRLLVPFMIFTILGECVIIIHYILNENFQISNYLKELFSSLVFRGSTMGNLPLWFLPSLFTTKVIFTICQKFKIATITLLISSFTIAFAVNMIAMRVPLWIGNVSMAVFMYTCGYNLKTYIARAKLMNNLFLTVFNIIAFLLFFSVVIFRWCNSDFRSIGGCFPFNAYWFIISLTSVVLFNEILERYIYKSNVFTRIGRESMVYYVMHWIVINLSVIFFIDILSMDNNVEVFCYTILLQIAILPLSVKLFQINRLKWMIGQK